MNRKVLLFCILCVIPTAGTLNAWDDRVPLASPPSPEQAALVCGTTSEVAVLYQVTLVEMKRNDSGGNHIPVALMGGSETSSATGNFFLLSDIEKYFLLKSLTKSEAMSVVAQPKILASLGTKAGIITGNAQSWYEIAFNPQYPKTPGVIPTEATLVRREICDGKEETYRMHVSCVLPAGGSLVMNGTLGDKDVLLLVTAVQAVKVLTDE